MNIFKFLMIAAVVFTVNMLLFFAISAVIPNFDWALWGFSMISAFAIVDIVRMSDRDKFPGRLVFKNLGDTVTVIVALMTASAIHYLPEWSGDERFLVKLLSTLLAVAVVFLFVFLFGTRQLKEDFWMRKKKNNESSEGASQENIS